MEHVLNLKSLTGDKINISFKMGLEIAVFILEMAEGLSSQERKWLIDELKQNIGQSEEN
jgi:hypothetical protein